MRKLLSVVLASVAVVGTSSSIMASQGIAVTVNGQKVSFPDAQPFVDSNNRTMVPVRFVSEVLGADVSFKTYKKANKLTKEVVIEHDKDYISLFANEKWITVNSTKKAMDTEAVIKDSRVFVPLRFISEGLGAQVEWISKKNTVAISTDYEVKIPEPIDPVQKVEKEVAQTKPVTSYGNAFIGKANKNRYNTVSVSNRFPINTGTDEIYSVSLSKDGKHIEVVSKPIKGDVGFIYLSDKKGLNRGRNPIETIADSTGVYVTSYEITSLSDYELDGEAYTKFSKKDIEYIVFTGTDSLYAVSMKEVLK